MGKTSSTIILTIFVPNLEKLNIQLWIFACMMLARRVKTTKNAIFGLFSGAKIDFLPFLKLRKMCFLSFEIALLPILEHRGL